MELLLDTHIALWAISDSKRLTRQEVAPRHNDLFDRLLLAQAKTEGFGFVTHDSLIAGYNEPCVMTI